MNRKKVAIATMVSLMAFMSGCEFTSYDKKGDTQTPQKSNNLSSKSVVDVPTYTTSSSTTPVKIQNTQDTSNKNPYLSYAPKNATKKHYDAQTLSIVTGKVYDKNNKPLAGIKVSVLNHPEFGSCVTNENGSYILPVDTYKKVTIRFSKDGYLSVDRTIELDAKDWSYTPDITLLQKDSKATTIDLSKNEIQTHISSTVTDERGSRNIAIVFDKNTHAYVTSMSAYATDYAPKRELKRFKVRATEFKTPNSMPGNLPSTSAFTYCVDITVDGVEDDESVVFDKPVVTYVDNFLGFDVGEIVPAGYYNRKLGKWMASDNGVVVRLLDTNKDGVVDALDSDGDNVADDLNNNGDIHDEVEGIANNPKYKAGDTYWRVAITHFTPWDYNWPYAPPTGATKPRLVLITDNEPVVIDCPIVILASSDGVDSDTRNIDLGGDRQAPYKVIFDLKKSQAPSSVQGARVDVFIAGRKFSQRVALNAQCGAKILWDGKDLNGKIVQGPVKAKVKAVYLYNLYYYRASSSFARAWAQSGSSPTRIIGRKQIEYYCTKASDIQLNILDTALNQHPNIKNKNLKQVYNSYYLGKDYYTLSASVKNILKKL